MYIDIIAGIILILGIIIGFKKGFFFEVLSFFTLVLNVVLAKRWTPYVFDYIKVGTKLNDDLVYFFTYLGVLLGLYIATSLVLSILKRTLPKMFMGVIDSILGGIIGGVKGSFLVLILLIFFNLSTTLIKGVGKYSNGSIVNNLFLKNVEKLEGYYPDVITEKFEEFKFEEYIKSQLEEYMAK
jgi:membrane protein required for colicin V production